MPKRKADEIVEDAVEPNRKLTSQEKLKQAKEKVKNGFAARDKARLNAATTKNQGSAAVRQFDDDDSDIVSQPKRKKRKSEADGLVETATKTMSSKQKERQIAREKYSQLYTKGKVKKVLTPSKAPARLVAPASVSDPVPQALPQTRSPSEAISAASIPIHNTAQTLQHQHIPEQLILEQKSRLLADEQLLRLSNLLSPLPPSMQQGLQKQRFGDLLPLPSLQQDLSATSTSVTTTIPVDSELEKVTMESHTVEDDDDHACDHVPPPAGGLQAQISKQVLINARRDLEEVQEELPVGNIAEESRDSSIHGQNVYTYMNKFRLKLVILLAILLASFRCAFYISPDPAKSTFEEASNLSPEKEDQCFFDSKSGLEYENICTDDDDDACSESGHEASCSDGDNGIVCPIGGVCEGGKLIDCLNMFQDVSNKGDQCVLSDQYLSMGTTITDTFVDHASLSCNKSAERIKYTILQGEQPGILVDESPELIYALESEGYRLYKEDDGLYLELPPDYILDLPPYCMIGDTIHWVLETVGSLLCTVIMIVSTNFWGLLMNYPKLSGAGLLSFFCFILHCRHQSRKKYTWEVQEMTYKTLMSSSGSHVVLHIRDAIAYERHPNSNKQRQFLITQVWPKIVNVVKRDTRVRKTKLLDGGKTRDKWQWDAAQTSLHS